MLTAELSELKNIPVCFTLGSFDGLHLGHRSLLNVLRAEAEKSRSRSLVISFYPHPRKVVNTEYDIKLLNTQSEKISILDSLGTDIVHFIKFTKETAAQTYSDFYNNYIFRYLDVKHIVIGENHGFGKDRNGNNLLLGDICASNSIPLSTVGSYIYKDKPISSTRIRNALISGNVLEAGEMLGYEYSVEAVVEKGKGIGRKIGFPTANFKLTGSEKIIPANGVYFTKSFLDDKMYYSMTNIGYNPTMGDNQLSMETHLTGFDENIYGRTLKVSFIQRIRDEKRFFSADELKIALEQDQNKIKIMADNFIGTEI